MSEIQSIQWFPGHMTKTKRKIQESLKLVEAVAEIIDARVPVSSRNPDLDQLIRDKPRIVLLNKSDMADPAQTAQWIDYFKKQGAYALAIDCKSGKGLNGFIPLVRSVLANQIKAWEAKGMVGRTIRVMIVGIPNVGKSSFINKMSKTSKVKVEDRPGVTRGNQWVTIGKGFDLLDTPGVLWPKFDDPAVGEKLAFTGAVKDQIMDTEQLAGRLLELLSRQYPISLQRYKLQEADLSEKPGYELLSLVGRKRGMLISGGEIDTERAAIMVLDEFRGGKLGRITLEPVK
ncbi:MAG: ribosome biogenesis GTPase YlqF [Clostridiales bacterium]|jgi:ribosome biogenesis GTPase A|nr:ribosome biogenesis GTPase YlqF [Clostridiales bacterium]